MCGGWGSEGRWLKNRPPHLVHLTDDHHHLNESELDMAWTEPQYSNREIDSTGRQLASDPVGLTLPQFNILSNFRASHGFPLNTLQMRLRYIAHEIDDEAVVNQRLKRRQSIMAKLGKMTSLRLSKMQDIGGCRAVVSSVDQVDKLATIFKSGRARHHLIKENDYVAEPKQSGYRSLHLVYAYQSDKKSTYNGMKIEIQLRSELQHIWAMAVETVGKITDQSLKSGLGDNRFLRFFALMSSWFAIHEDRPTVSQTPASLHEIESEMRRIDGQIKIVESVQSYTIAASAIDNIAPRLSEGLFLIDLDIENRRLDAKPFLLEDYSSRVQQHERAFEEYRLLEHTHRDDVNRDVVLVSAEDVRSLKLAYPSYFGDMVKFVFWGKRILDD